MYKNNFFLPLIMLVMNVFTNYSDFANNYNFLEISSINNVYKFVKKQISNSRYKSAIRKLKSIENNYQTGIHSQKICLYYIYIYYKLNNFDLFNEQINYFLRFNYDHPNTDYVFYMIGLMNMKSNKNYISRLIFKKNINYIFPRDAKTALHYFNMLVNLYPKSKYLQDTLKYITFLKEYLSEFELNIVKYYNDTEAYIAVIKRSENILNNFRDTKAAYETLFYMEKAYRKLNLHDQANKIINIMSSNKIEYQFK